MTLRLSERRSLLREHVTHSETVQPSESFTVPAFTIRANLESVVDAGGRFLCSYPARACNGSGMKVGSAIEQAASLYTEANVLVRRRNVKAGLNQASATPLIHRLCRGVEIDRSSAYVDKGLQMTEVRMEDVCRRGLMKANRDVDKRPTGTTDVTFRKAAVLIVELNTSPCDGGVVETEQKPSGIAGRLMRKIVLAGDRGCELAGAPDRYISTVELVKLRRCRCEGNGENGKRREETRRQLHTVWISDQ